MKVGKTLNWYHDVKYRRGGEDNRLTLRRQIGREKTLGFEAQGNSKRYVHQHNANTVLTNCTVNRGNFGRLSG